MWEREREKKFNDIPFISRLTCGNYDNFMSAWLIFNGVYLYQQHVYRGHVYILLSHGVCVCIWAKTGKAGIDVNQNKNDPKNFCPFHRASIWILLRCHIVWWPFRFMVFNHFQCVLCEIFQKSHPFEQRYAICVTFLFIIIFHHIMR